MMKRVSSLVVVALFVSGSLLVLAEDTDVVHAVGGVVTKVDSTAKTVAVKTADGSEQVYKYTAKTTVHASKEVAKGVSTASVDTYLAGKEGTHVVVHYTVEGADKTAVGFEDFGKDGLKVSKGTVTHVDHAAHTVTIKTEDGTEETYHVAKDVAVDTEHGVVKGVETSTKEGEHVTVHYTESAGRKVAHLIKHLYS